MQLLKIKSVVTRIWLLLVFAGVAVFIDQVSKRLIEKTIPLDASTDFLSIAGVPYLLFTHTQNTGAAFSLFQNGGVFFAVLAVVVSALIVYYTPKLPSHDWLSRLALGLQLGGIIGNLIDRIRQGYVTDFIHFQIPAIGFDFAVFNGADSCIFIGTVLLLVASLRSEKVSPSPVQNIAGSGN